MNYICKNCYKFITEAEYQKEKEAQVTADGCGCLFILIVLCFCSLILIPIAVLLLFIVYNKQPDIRCPYCNASSSLLPENTPLAQKLLQEYYNQEDIQKIAEIKFNQEQKIIEKNEQDKKDKKIINIGWLIIIIFFILLVVIGNLPHR